VNKDLPQPTTIILFGATGDLANRKLYPALYELYKKNKDTFAVIGTARRDWGHDHFREVVATSLPDESDESRNAFLQRFFYYSLDVNNTQAYEGLNDLAERVDKDFDLNGNRIYYLALAPDYFGTVTINLKKARLTNGSGWKRLIIEKPFGKDLESAQELNRVIRDVFEEDEIFRIDHYLGKEMVQNIQVLRFSNPIFESIWNNRYISNVQITSSETLGVGERSGYYDRTGALLDMVQNHILQMTALTAMEPPSRLETEDIRDEKVKVLRSLRPTDALSVTKDIVRGQYGRGILPNGETALSYREEDNIPPDSNTDTFIAAKLYIDNFRWAGVPFYIRTGKRMTVKSTQIVIQFKEAPLNPYFSSLNEQTPNLLVIHVQPDEGLTLKLNAKKFSHAWDTMPISLDFCNNCSKEDRSSDAYERLIGDCMRGDSTNFTRWDEVALSWQYVDGIIRAWDKNHIPLNYYEAGSMGPKESHQLLEKDGLHWWPLTKLTN
jgi:glucose-6-phosphate 1-dehydrogenase